MAKKITFLASFSGEIGTKRPGTQKELKALTLNNLTTRAQKLGLQLKLEEFKGRIKVFAAEDRKIERLLRTTPGLGKIARFHELTPSFPVEDLLPERPFTFEIYVTKWEGGAAKERALNTKKELLKKLEQEALKRLKAWDGHPPSHLFWEIEAYDEGLILLENPVQGAGGLPIGSTGKALLLFSGGPDSLLAAWLLMKRGLSVSLVFFDDGETERERRVKEAAEALAYFTPEGKLSFWRLYYRPFLETLKKELPERERCLYCKALMLRLAEVVLSKEKGDVMATGDILGEQASQTLAALKFINGSRFLLRPLLAFNKEEVFEKLSALGLKALAQRRLPPCSFAPERPRTAPRKDPLKAEKILRKLARKPVEMEHFSLETKGV